MLTPEQLTEALNLAADTPDRVLADRVPKLVAEVKRLQAALKDACEQVTQADDREAAAAARAHAAEAKVRRVGMAKTWTNEDGKKFAFVEDVCAALADQPAGEAAGR